MASLTSYTWWRCPIYSMFYAVLHIKTHGSESRGQGGSSKRRPDGLETHTREYFTGTRVVKFENSITEEP